MATGTQKRPPATSTDPLPRLAAPSSEERPRWLQEEITAGADRRHLAADVFRAHERARLRTSAAWGAVAGVFFASFVGLTSFMPYLVAGLVLGAAGWVVARVEAGPPLGAVIGGVASFGLSFLLGVQAVYALFGWVLGTVIGAIVAIRAEQERAR